MTTFAVLFHNYQDFQLEEAEQSEIMPTNLVTPTMSLNHHCCMTRASTIVGSESSDEKQSVVNLSTKFFSTTFL